MTEQETVALILLWGKLAPDEPNGFDARVAEAKWSIEHVYKIADFWKADDDASYQQAVDYRQETNDAYDRRLAR